jgi:intracellular sulfur oxidation DsrE/DsrF family protein
MTEKGMESAVARRMFLTRLGAGVGVVGASVVSSSAMDAQATTDAPWRPARHPQDDWYDKIPGVHRFVFDTTTADGMAIALRFADNYYTVNHTDYGLNDSDLAVVIIARHKSTPFGFNDAMWAKYGKQLSEHAEFVHPKTKAVPSVNLYAAADDGTGQAGRLNGLIKKGAQFAVCQMATRAMAGGIAKATGGKADVILKEIGDNLIANARLVPAGILAVNRAQEWGYSFAYAV